MMKLISLNKFLRIFHRNFSISCALNKSNDRNSKAAAVQQNDTVLADRFKSVTIISLNRPAKQNAFNKSMLKQLGDQLKAFEEDGTSTVAVLNGIGGNFSVGYDMDELKENGKNVKAMVDNLVIPFRRSTTKPILCSISGACRSIGFELALMCDVLFLEDKTVLGFSNRLLGTPLLNDGPNRLAKLIGLSKAMDITLTGREVLANEAVEMGLANIAVPDGTALGRALKFAVHLSSLPQSSLRHDLSVLYGSKAANDSGSEFWSNIVEEISLNANLDDLSRKNSRVLKLNNMPDWELDEIEREKEYAKKKSDAT